VEIPVTPTYFQLHEATLKFGLALGEFVIEGNTRVVGIARGGLFMANILSHQLNLPVSVVNYSSKTGRGEYQQHSNELPFFIEKNLIIVDDICDSGNTMHEVYEVYGVYRPKHSIYTMVYYAKEGSVFTPDVSWYKIPYDFDWVIFPWEDTLVV